AVAAAGWSIASHAATHRRLTELAPADVARELTASKTRIEDEIGAAAETIAYPYGAASPEVERIAGELYAIAFGTALGYATPSSRRTDVERIDAYYLQGRALTALDGAVMRGYLSLRRAGRALRATARR